MWGRGGVRGGVRVGGRGRGRGGVRGGVGGGGEEVLGRGGMVTGCVTCIPRVQHSNSCAILKWRPFPMLAMYKDVFPLGFPRKMMHSI